jgi:hypothetical protein
MRRRYGGQTISVISRGVGFRSSRRTR